MTVGEHHFELVADWDTGEHIADCAFNGSDSGVSLLLLEPDLELKDRLASLCGFVLVDLDGDVLESFGELSERALHVDLSGLDINFNSFRDLEVLLCYNVLHDK